MNASTIALHDALIRAAKGVITAWEKWLEARKQEAKQ